ncbi:hypothetical protein MMC22_009306 [Lobaria immixta]|nr:hypothetical protein [Lobaria immixta]
MSDTTPTRGLHQGRLREEIGRYLNRRVGVHSRDPEGVRLLQAVAEFLDLEAHKAVVKKNSSAPILGTLKIIQERLDCIKKQGSTKTQQQGSYASVAAIGKTAAKKTGATLSAMMKEEESSGRRRLRELVIRIENKKEREQGRSLLAENILQKLQSTKHAKTSQLVAARRLQSGDTLLQAATVKAREQLERNVG